MSLGAVLLTKLDEEMKTRSQLGQDVLAGTVRPVTGLKVALEADVLPGTGQSGLGEGEVPDHCDLPTGNHLLVGIEDLTPGQSLPGGLEPVGGGRLLTPSTRS